MINAHPLVDATKSADLLKIVTRSPDLGMR